MAGRNFDFAITLSGWCIIFVSLAGAESPVPSCPGPVKHYNEIGCTPVYKNEGDLCPEKYNCDHLKNIPADKCFANGHEYAVREELREEDRKPCDIGCVCSGGGDGQSPQFMCAQIQCPPARPGCYRKREAGSCCGGKEVCPASEAEIPTCEVDGQIYKDGDFFRPLSQPDKDCYCGEGFTMEKLADFCTARKADTCGTTVRNNHAIRENCAPTYYHGQSPQNGCTIGFRCQNIRDVVVPRLADAPMSTDPGMKCMFGNLTMNVSDELNQATHYDSVCIRCICEVPPIPTCRRLSDEECDIRNHPDFSNL